MGGEWAFGSGWRRVPDQWKDAEAGGSGGRGSGSYKLTVLLPDKNPPLALRYATVATAFSVRVDGTEIARVGTPGVDPARTVPAYAPGTVNLPSVSVLNLEIFVSNQIYRVGGLWSVPSLGPEEAIEHARWADEAGSMALAVTLSVIGVVALLLFTLRRKEKTFLHLGVFALIVALRSLVTGEYVLIRIVPGLPFDVIVRLEYLTAFLLLPSGLQFFEAFFPKLWHPRTSAILLWPSRIFAVFVFFLPIEILTRTISFYYPIALPSLIFAAIRVIMRIKQESRGLGLLAGVVALLVTGMIDMASSAFFSITGNLVPWGLGIFAFLEATTLARGFIAAFEKNEALLAEKDLLVKEVHHRVKNSLQVVASLVSLQAHRIPDPAQKAIFQALRQRITAVALVHEKLYGRGLTGRPDLAEYLRDLIALQYPGDGLETRVTWEIHLEPLEVGVGVDDCIDTGLILTELVSNAHKHGLLPQGGGQLSIEMKTFEDRLTLEVGDDGRGFPRDFQPESSSGLGFRLIQALLQRHEGTLTFPSGMGGRIRVDLKVLSAQD